MILSSVRVGAPMPIHPLASWPGRNSRTIGMSGKIGAGGIAKFVQLPALGIEGNGHVMMMDKNNLQTADLIID
jgi:hypothetical protein